MAATQMQGGASPRPRRERGRPHSRRGSSRWAGAQRPSVQAGPHRPASAAGWRLEFVSWLPSAGGRYPVTSSAQRRLSPALGPPSGRTGGAEGQASGRPSTCGGGGGTETHTAHPAPTVEPAGRRIGLKHHPGVRPTCSWHPACGLCTLSRSPQVTEPLFAASCNGLAERPHGRGRGWWGVDRTEKAAKQPLPARAGPVGCSGPTLGGSGHAQGLKTAGATLSRSWRPGAQVQGVQGSASCGLGKGGPSVPLPAPPAAPAAGPEAASLRPPPVSAHGPLGVSLCPLLFS